MKLEKKNIVLDILDAQEKEKKKEFFYQKNILFTPFFIIIKKE